jgi:hypothetical protein
MSTTSNDDEARAEAILQWVAAIERAMSEVTVEAQRLRDGVQSKAGRVLLDSHVAVVKATAARGPFGQRAESRPAELPLRWQDEHDEGL